VHKRYEPVQSCFAFLFQAAFCPVLRHWDIVVERESMQFVLLVHVLFPGHV
jgi:hypothetical protein